MNASSSHPTRPARPIGLVFAAIVLGFFALATLLSGTFTCIAAFAMAQHALAATPGTPPPPPPQVLKLLIAAVGIFELLVAAWGVSTIVGLVRLKSWARYSILVIGGLLTLFGITSAAFLALLPKIMAVSSPQAELPPHLMQGMLLFLGLFYTGMAAVGIWWLVYFNLGTIKAFFLPHYAPAANPYLPTAASLATPGGLPYPPQAQLPPAPAGRFAHVPTSIKVVACFFLFAGFLTAILTFLPFPAFLLGFYLTGLAGHLVYLAYTLLLLLIGIGLFRLENRARFGLYAITALALVNAIVLLTPWGRARFAFYNLHLQQQMRLPAAPTLFDPTNPLFTLIGLVFTLAFYGVLLFLVERHRTLFNRN